MLDKKSKHRTTLILTRILHHIILRQKRYLKVYMPEKNYLSYPVVLLLWPYFVDYFLKNDLTHF